MIVVLTTIIIGFLYNLKAKNTLPFYGEDGHTVGSFSFTDQKGQLITEEYVKGKIRVVEFFFTTCKGICPKMNQNLKKVYTYFNDATSVLFLSFTVNPEKDSVSVLQDYAENLQVDEKRWKFFTGNKDSLYKVAEKDYLLAAVDAEQINEEFIHTQYFALIDQQNRIRGYYDGTSEKEMLRLISDIKLLL